MIPIAIATVTIPDTAFVVCVERGPLEAQVFLLAESIRRFGGVLADATIYALAPRSGGGIGEDSRARLRALGVTYVDEVLNTECVEYGSANRVLAAAYVERVSSHELLVVLDSDTVFLREPRAFVLPADVDVALRPVDVKGMCTSGPDDVRDAYWRELAAVCGVDYESIPWTNSFVDRVRIRASYNGGLVVARGGLGIMQRWADFFLRSVRRNMHPHVGVAGFQAGAGWVDPAAGRWWGSNQAALSLAVWSSTRRVVELEPTYNYPLHLHDSVDPAERIRAFSGLSHVHYHWLFGEEQHASNPLTDSRSPLSPDQRAWLLERLPLDTTRREFDRA